MSLFIAYIIDVKKLQSSTIKSYISAIKTTLKVDGYPWDDRKVLTNTFTKACRQVNDRAFIRLPIHCGLLEVLLFEIKRKFASQPYLESLYLALFAIGYYGLLRVGEITLGPHVIKAKNIFISHSKLKLLIILYTSKTHNQGLRP